MFRALFTTAKIRTQPNRPTTEEWIKMWYIYSIEYYSAITKNEILSFVTTWIDLEGIMLSEISQRQRQILYVITYMWDVINKYNKTETDSKIQGASSYQWGEEWGRDKIGVKD